MLRNKKQLSFIHNDKWSMATQTLLRRVPSIRIERVLRVGVVVMVVIAVLVMVALSSSTANIASSSGRATSTTTSTPASFEPSSSSSLSSSSSTFVAQQHHPKTSLLLDTSSTFNDVQARAFEPWPLDRALPCFPAEPDWASESRQNNGACRTGFLFMRPLKCGSTSTIGMLLRMLHNVAKRTLKYNNNNTSTASTTSIQQPVIPMCQVRFTHGYGNPPLAQRFAQRDKVRSYLFTLLRDPTQRVISTYNFFQVARRRTTSPTDADFRAWLANPKVRQTRVQDYYLLVLPTIKTATTRTIVTTTTGGNATTSSNINSIHRNKIATIQNILESYDFIGITERFDESAVALMMLLRLELSDILYLRLKQSNHGFDYAWKGCYYIFPPYVSPLMQNYFENSLEWQEIIQYDAALYRAANRSLDLTIAALGGVSFQDNLQLYTKALQRVEETCASVIVHRCTEGGQVVPTSATATAGADCLWDNTACGMECLDRIATELGLLPTTESE